MTARRPPQGDWPRLFGFRSLTGQLIFAVLVALVVAQAVGFAIFNNERREAILFARREQVVQRTAALARMLEKAPNHLQGDLLQALLGAAASRRLRYWVADTSAVNGADPANANNAFAQALTAQLDHPPRSPVLVEVRELDDPDLPPVWWVRRGPPGTRPALAPPNQMGEEAHERDRAHGHDRDHDRDHGPAAGEALPPAVSLAFSVPLSSGRWLNGEMAVPPPRRWPLPPLLGLLITAAAVCAATILVVRRLTRPLADLAAAADALGRGEPIAPLAPRGPEELRRTTAAFNRMQERLHRFVADRTRMLAAISHDLRTPLTSLRLRAEFITDDEENKRKIMETLDEMARMTEATLAFARDESNQGVAEDTDLAALVAGLAEDLGALGQTVTVTAPAPVVLSCQPVALKRALRNLIENAVKYGGAAEVLVEIDGHDARIRVDDHGPGIPDQELENVFEPFVRLEASRSQETGGVGLGLAIARTIIHAHGGDIRLSNRAEGGLRAEIRLPQPDVSR